MLCKKCKVLDIIEYVGQSYPGKFMPDELCWRCHESYKYIMVAANVETIPDDLIIKNVKFDYPIHDGKEARAILKRKGVYMLSIRIEKKNVFLYREFLSDNGVNIKEIYDDLLKFFGRDLVWYRTDGSMIINNDSYYGRFCDELGEIIFKRSKHD